jgi:hypothetical protein
MRRIQLISTDFFPVKKRARWNSLLQSVPIRVLFLGTLIKPIQWILTDFFPVKKRASLEPDPTICAYLHHPFNPCSLHQHKRASGELAPT